MKHIIIDALMYGVTPSAKTAHWLNAPPDIMFRYVSIFPLLNMTDRGVELINGTARLQPTRNKSNIPIVNSNFALSSFTFQRFLSLDMESSFLRVFYFVLIIQANYCFVHFFVLQLVLRKFANGLFRMV